MAREKITHQRRNISLRLEILDELLSSHIRRNYEDLLNVLNEKLEDRGEVPIVVRTLKYDITFLEDKKNAPIHRPTKQDPFIYYTEKFSYKNVPLEEEDVSLLRQAIDILKKATSISIINDIDAIVTKLENKVHTNVPSSVSMIAFEEHTQALGQEHIDNLFNAIKEKCVLKILYQPFGKEAAEWIIHPYMLKEYRNRWFLIGRRSGLNIPYNLALDRIRKVSVCKDAFEENDLFDPETYFNDMVGVTLPQDGKIETIVIKVQPLSADYILTKPIHKSQITLKQYKNGGVKVQLQLYINFELKAHLMSYGPNIEVVEPISLREEMQELYQKGMDIYK